MNEPQWTIERFLDFWAIGVRFTWFILPVIVLAGVCGELTRRKTGVGAPRARAMFTVFSVVVILFMSGYSALCYWDSQTYTREYFLVMLEVGIWMSPTMLLAIIQLLLHWRTPPPAGDADLS